MEKLGEELQALASFLERFNVLAEPKAGESFTDLTMTLKIKLKDTVRYAALRKSEGTYLAHGDGRNPNLHGYEPTRPARVISRILIPVKAALT